MPRSLAAMRSDHDSRTVAMGIASCGCATSAQATGLMVSLRLPFMRRKSDGWASSIVVNCGSLGEADAFAPRERVQERLVKGVVDLTVDRVRIGQPGAKDVAHQHQHAR